MTEVIQACTDLGAHCSEAQDAATYFTHNTARMRYDQYRAKDYLMAAARSKAVASKSSRTSQMFGRAVDYPRRRGHSEGAGGVVE